MIPKQNERGLKRLTAMTLFLLAVALLTSACGNNRHFNSTEWLKGDLRARGRMSEDLVKSRILLGKTIDEAKHVLGPPDIVYPTALQYKIDLGWAFKDPSHYGLQVHLDDQRLVREVKIVD